MSNDIIKLSSETFSKAQFNKVVNTEFSELITIGNDDVETVSTNSQDVEDFFLLYNELFYNIPKEGENSHKSLIEQSSEYIDYNNETENYQTLLLEIERLNNELLQKEQEIINLQMQLI